MSVEPSIAVRLFGTEEPVTPPRLLAAGPLTAEFEAGNLRYIRFGGVEVMRAVSFIVRDKDWGTYNPEISNLVVSESAGGFRVSYEAVAADALQKFHYKAVIEGTSDGRLVFRGAGEAASDFLTNRTGFVVLHPAGVSGLPAEIRHVDGRIVKGSFPERIDPVQPMMDLRAITHEAAPGLKVSCLMEGDTYEMEDQRNWTDASYKTYVRPLALPWPYTLKAGEKIDQSVTLEISGTSAGAGTGDAITLSLGAEAGRLPPLGAGLDPDDVEATLREAAALKAVGLAHVICHHDPRRGHDAATLQRQVEAAKAIGATPWLEAVIVSIDGALDEIARLGAEVAKLGAPFPTVLVSPAPDMKCTLPGSVWPPCPPLEQVYEAARKAFPQARLGGGMFSYFTELNRKRPPVSLLDVVSFTTSAMVHAGDDRSMTESLQAAPAIAASAAAIAAPKPIVVGPSAIGMRANPYGDVPKQNPDNIRQAMNWNDPRQRGLLGAAWNLGYIAHFAHGGAGAITLGGLTGAFGLRHVPAAFPQPWYDANGGWYPLAHILRGLAAQRDAVMRQVIISRPGEVLGLAIEGADGLEVWLGNLANQTVRVALDFDIGQAAVLDAGSFVEASAALDHLDHFSTATGREIVLSPYAVARLR